MCFRITCITNRLKPNVMNVLYASNLLYVILDIIDLFKGFYVPIYVDNDDLSDRAWIFVVLKLSKMFSWRNLYISILEGVIRAEMWTAGQSVCHIIQGSGFKPRLLQHSSDN